MGVRKYTFQSTTKDLLAEYGSEEMSPGSGTFQEAWDAAEDGNSKYRIRLKILQRAGAMLDVEAIKVSGVELVVEDDEVTVTMQKQDWRIVHEYFTNMPHDEDWDEEGHLLDEQDESIRLLLEEAIS